MPTQLEVMKAESTFFGALIEVRTDELEMLLTDDLLLAELRGGIMPKTAFIQSVGSGQLRFDGIEPLEAVVRLYGSTAIVTGRTQRPIRRGLVYGPQPLYTRVCRATGKAAPGIRSGYSNRGGMTDLLP